MSAEEQTKIITPLQTNQTNQTLCLLMILECCVDNSAEFVNNQYNKRPFKVASLIPDSTSSSQKNESS